MKKAEISAKVTGGEPVTVTYDLPETLDEAVEKFGAEKVLNGFLADLRISLQSFIRTRIQKGYTQVQIQADVDRWAPGTRVGVGQKADPQQAFLAWFAALPPERQKEELQKLRSALSA
ncbi:MAG: hypothetical protein KatS3mg015_2750 [Fimbriimonadales bacterium]|nr:MAG: hypothetical protein KatS3mg015_2750 [Fimbriimonadales bacterium]